MDKEEYSKFIIQIVTESYSQGFLHALNIAQKEINNTFDSIRKNFEEVEIPHESFQNLTDLLNSDIPGV